MTHMTRSKKSESALVWIKTVKTRKKTVHVIWGHSDSMPMHQEVLLARLFEEWMVCEGLAIIWDRAFKNAKLCTLSELVSGPHGFHMGGWRHCHPDVVDNVVVLIENVHNIFKLRYQP